jgi:hypothetical protein
MGRGVGAQGGGAKSLLLLGHTGYISTTHQSLLRSTLSTTVHFNGSNGTAYTRPSMVRNNSSSRERGEGDKGEGKRKRKRKGEQGGEGEGGKEGNGAGKRHKGEGKWR